MSRFVQVSSVRMLQTDVERIFRDLTTADLGRLRRFVRDSAAARGCDSQAVDELIVAVNEAVANILRHGYQDEPGEVKVRVGGGEEVLVAILLDRGPPFDPTAIPSPDTTLPLEERPFGGMGVHLMREFCDELSYHRDPGGWNELTLLKRFGPQEEGYNH